jgi:hypothetical protein
LSKFFYEDKTWNGSSRLMRVDLRSMRLRFGGIVRVSIAFATSTLLAALTVTALPIGIQASSALAVISQLGADIDGEAANDRSGQSVALSSDGTRVAIGAPRNDGNGSDAGQVRIYDWNGTAWTQVGNDIDGEAAGDRSGTSVALSSDGSRVAIGASRNDGTARNAGHVRIYAWNGTAWTQVGNDIDGEASDDYSGTSVALSSNGNRVAIGAENNNGSAAGSGHVRVYDWNGTAWIQYASDLNGEAGQDSFGTSLALSSDGKRIAIGAPNNTVGDGHVRVFEQAEVEGGWSQLGSDIDGEAGEEGSSGHSVALSSDGTRVAIGAPDNEGGGEEAGHVRIYDWNGTSWIQAGSDIDGEAADYSGYSVALSSDGERVAIGSNYSSGSATEAGHVRIYDWNGTAWTQFGSDIDGEAAEDYSGTSVGLSSSGGRVAIGAEENDDSASDAGHVRVFSALESGLTPTFAASTKTADGFTVQVSNYDANYTWSVSATAGTATISGAGLITVTGLSAATSSTVTVGTSRLRYSPGSAAVSGVSTAALEGDVPIFRPYFGPIARPLTKTPANQGEESIISGFRMDTVESVHSGDHQFKIVSNSPSELVVLVPTGIHGLIDLTLAWENEGESGTYTIPQALDIALEMEPDDIQAKSLKKLTTGSFKGFIAIYTKGYEGSKLSAKVAGKWLLVDSLDESWRGNDYSRTVRFTGAGYDIFVHLYIDGEYIRTDELTTK